MRFDHERARWGFTLGPDGAGSRVVGVKLVHCLRCGFVSFSVLQWRCRGRGCGRGFESRIRLGRMGSGRRHDVSGSRGRGAHVVMN